MPGVGRRVLVVAEEHRGDPLGTLKEEWWVQRRNLRHFARDQYNIVIKVQRWGQTGQILIPGSYSPTAEQ